MAYAILGTPKPAFFDSSGAPLASGTLTVQDPDDSSAKDTYPTAVDADASTNGVSTAYTLDSRGEIATQLWGRDTEDYKVILKDSAAATVYTIDEIRLPPSLPHMKALTGDTTAINTSLGSVEPLSNVSLAPATYFKLTGYLLATADAAGRDIKIAWVVDQTLQESSYTYISVDAGTADTVDAGEVQAITASTTIDIDGTGDVGININGFLLTHATATTEIDFHMAQGTDAGTTTLKKGSWLKYEAIVV